MELALPITVYWDLPSDACLNSNLLQICDEILECRPLMLQLYDPSPVPGEGLRAILERFRGTPVSVSLTTQLSCLSHFAGVTPKELGVKELLVACHDCAALGTSVDFREMGISFYVSYDNWSELPAVVTYCLEHGLARLVMPMQRLYNGEVPFLLNRSEQEVLARSLAAIGGTGSLRLTIHDPFLWRAFNPGEPFPQGGCQAANTMIAISPDGGVYPCPTLPYRIGNIGSGTLREIIMSPAKKELRSSILSYPTACGLCSELTVCRGGCRGRSYLKYGTFDGVDDACR